jgi:hypothetical protein
MSSSLSRPPSGNPTPLSRTFTLNGSSVRLAMMCLPSARPADH